MDSYRSKISSVAKYASSQGVSLDSPRVRRYATAMGIDPDDLLSEITESTMQAATVGSVDTTKKYAERMGLPVEHETVQKYAKAKSEFEPDIERIDIGGSQDEEFKAAVLHYANSQMLDLDHPQVQKYAHGLLGHTGDFNISKQAQGFDIEATNRRIEDAIRRYAERMGLPIGHETVQKYADGLRKVMPHLFKEVKSSM